VAVTLIKQARVVDPEAGLDAVCDVLVADGQVCQIADNIEPDSDLDAKRRDASPPGLTVIDGKGLWLWPGLVDVHVHLREPGFSEKETVRTGTMAAAAGGYTTVVCEPNTEPALDSVAALQQLVDKCRTEAIVNVYFKAAMTMSRLGARPVDMQALAQMERVVALSDDGDPVIDPEVEESIFEDAARARLLLSPHCEDSPQALHQIAAGIRPGFQPGEPYTNETRYIERDLRLATECGCRIHFSHVSLASSVRAIQRGREFAPNRDAITFETTPHYLLLSADDFGEDAPKVNPPLRSAADRDVLNQALLDGTVDVIASDHAPHTVQDKEAGASGLIGLETTLALMLTHFVAQDRLSPSDAVRLMSVRPARIFGLPAGTLRPGSAADIVLLDPEREWTVEPEHFRSKARNTPFAGMRLRGKVVATFVGGEERYADATLAERKAD